MNQQYQSKIQDLFIHEAQDRLTYFYTSNQIIYSSKIVYHFFSNFSQYGIEYQEKILNAIIRALKTVSTNAYLLNENGSENSCRIIKILINLITHNVKNYLLFNLLLEVLNLLLPSSSLDEELIKNATSQIAQNLYDEKINVQHFFGTINIAKGIYNAKIEAEKQPKNILMFHGNKGLQILPNKKNQTLGWKFQHGMTLMFWIYIQNIKFGAQNKLPKLFTFYSPNKGGIQSYLVDNKVFYRVLGSKYSQPQIGSNGINLGQIQPKKWTFICFQHEGSKAFMKSKLNFYINKNKPATFSIDPPKISKNQQTKYVFFDNFYGKSSSITLFTHPIGSQQIQQYNKNINSMQQSKKTKCFLFQLHQGKLYQRNGFGYCPNYILQRNLNMNFNNILPYFYILKFITQQSHTYPILNQLLSLIVLFFRKSSKNQNLAFSEQYFKVLSSLINRANQKIYDENSIKSILHIKHTITDTQLLDQYFSDFLWPIIGANAQMERKQQIIQIVKNSFMQNIGHYRSVIGLDQMLNYLIKMEPKSISCCQKHFNLVSKRIQTSFYFQSLSKAYRTTINYILQLIELYFQNPNINFAEQCYKLCRLLTLKFSPCFILDYISLIKRIMNQKLNQKISQSQIKKIMKYFKQKKLYLIFLHVIENNFFAEIKAEAVKIIYQVLLLKKGEEKDQNQISLEISKALWKINEEVKNTAISSPSKSNKQHQNSSDQQKNVQKLPSKNEKIEEQEYTIPNKTKAFGVIDIQQDDNDKQYKQVGPKAPMLRNRDKGNKTFDFNFVNKSKKPNLQIKPLQRQIVQEQKTIDPPSDDQKPVSFQLQEIPKKKNIKKSFGLSINTEQINQMYTFGGEKGQQIIVSEQQQTAQLQKIKRLARICVNSMRKGRGQPILADDEPSTTPQPENKKNSPMMMPPPTTKNKTVEQRKKKNLNLNFINQEEDQEQQDQDNEVQETTKKQPVPSFGRKKPSLGLKIQQIKQQQKTPNNQSNNIPSSKSASNKKYFTHKSVSNISPSSNKSSSASQQNLLSLYSSLLQCLLNKSFQTSLIENSIIQVPSILCIFFKWIPQTDLQTKFLNDLDIITQQQKNIEQIILIPELYDFLFELCYKCILMEQMGEKRIYVEKLQNFIKKIFSYIFREDPVGNSKINYIMDWSIQKKSQYHPKSLLLTTRYAVVLILQSFQQVLLMNKLSSDKIRQRNFQSMGCLLEAMLKYIPAESEDEFYLDEFQRVILAQNQEIITSLSPYFRSRWIDETACRKYYYLFKKFFSTQWFNKGQIKLQNGQTNFVQIGINQLQRQSSYFLRDNYLVSIVQIAKALFMNQTQQSDGFKQLSLQIIWQLVVLIILSQTNRQKTVKNHRSQRILCFLKNCKFLAQKQIKQVTNIIPILSTTKHFLGIMKMNIKQDAKSNSPLLIGDGVLDEIISNYIPQQLLKLDKTHDIQSFKLYFSDVWVPSQNHYKKLHSQIYLKQKQKNKKIEEKIVNFIQNITTIIEEENQRFSYLQILIEADKRKSLNKFRKIWDMLRIYNQIWKVPQMKLQVDTLFNKSIYSYEKYQGNPFFKYKISKHQSKAKARYFLKPRLNQTKFSQKQLGQVNLQEKNQIFLSKAILYSTQNLSIGKSKLNWLYDKDSIKELQIVFSFKKIHLINTLTIRTGHLAIINDKLIFTASYFKQKSNHLAIKQYQVRKDKSLYKIWPLQYIKDVLRRRYVNRKKAIQITFIHGKSLLFQFLDQNDLEDFFKKLTKLKGNKCPNLSFLSKTTDPKKILQNYGYLTKWNNYQMSNFEYLMELNNIAGRSYADTTQYPVMPWILVNFTAQKLSLSQQSNFRNLQLPMGALGSAQRTANFEQRYHMLTIDNNSKQKRFHYGTHYSSPGIIYHFLIRLYPFTEGAILLQSGKFDFADRLFFSIGDSFKNATTQHSDVRQLLPQLYTLPQVYLNINKLDLGIMQSKKRVNNIQLPQWARQNPYLYITKIKKSFEQNKVSQNINHWIDLIFGYKQRGQQAVKSLNCFYYLTYEDSVDWDQIQNEKEIHAIESQIINFGQTPSQVFIKPHPTRNNLFMIKNFNSICDPKAQIKVYRPSKNKNLLQQQPQLNPLHQFSQSIIHMKWVKDDKLVFIRRNGQMLFYKLHPPNNTSSTKIPFQCAIQKQKKIQKMEKSQGQYYQFDPSLQVTSFPIEFINKGNIICLGGLLDGKLMLIDVETQNILQTYNAHQHTISCIRADTKDNFLITGDIKGNVIIWRLVNGYNSYKLTVYQSFNDQKLQITSIFFSYQLKCFAVSSMDGSVFVYNIITSKKIRAYYHPNKMPVNDIIISTNPLASIVLFSNQEGLIYCYSINGQLIQRVHQKESQCFLAATLLKDSLGFQYLTYGNQKGQTIIRAMPYLDNPTKLNVAKQAVVNRVCPSRNGKFLVTGCSDGQLSIITDPNTNIK